MKILIAFLLIAKRLRKVGLKPIFFGSDMSTGTNAPPGAW